ncbi:hypothetical protein RSSM_04436 [Rhodopirellula sallentina SM41]|uniref:Uncharacterized protein n=1 Tax=Rhodopirellula sallentina SM41 TaxID=1263870 RepID=M5TY27_9BACT|nr:hypothetical protein RSSM_04436 [Rhodopirellula sallentina SM41]
MPPNETDATKAATAIIRKFNISNPPWKSLQNKNIAPATHRNEQLTCY